MKQRFSELEELQQGASVKMASSLSVATQERLF
jgi:hypothetical protein